MRYNYKEQGFTLIEIAVVLVIMALVLGASLTIISAQQDQRRIDDTKARLGEAREALIGFAIAHGHLPCPADPTIATGTANAGIERVAISGGCTGGASSLQGDLPWSTLGLSETDAWGHRFTYRVAAIYAGTTPFFGLSDTGDIAIGTTAGGTDIAIQLPAVIVSHGMNGFNAYLPSGSHLPGSGDADETENADIDANFVSKALTPTFDDQLAWLSQYILFNRMVQAGKLP
jgi:prepilin-type N-terminal cleavage/methylation domain-containing protein